MADGNKPFILLGCLLGMSNLAIAATFILYVASLPPPLWRL